MADVKKEYEDYEVVFFRRTEKEDEEEAKQESLESYQYRLQSKRHRNMMESLSFKNLSREEDEDEDEETNPSPSKSAKTLAPTSPLNNLPSFENMECLPVVVPYFRRIEIIGSKEEPTGTREIPDLWFPASAIDEKDLNRFSSYAQTVIKRYNKVKKTDFEFVRLVKMRWTLGHVYLRFKAKSSGAGPSATLKTFEGDVRCNLCLVNEEDGRPLSCRLIGRNFDDYLYAYPPPDGNILTNIVNALIAVPHFYTQVLHLINKMNIPAPFRMALPTPPLPPLVPAPPPPPPPPPVSAKPHAADLFSDESEIMESSDVEIDVRAYSAGASAVKKSGRKCLRQEAIVGPAVDKDVAHEAIGVKPATLVPKRIPMIKKKNPVLQIKIAPKVIQNEHRDESTADELEEPDKEGSDIKSYANPEELESGKLPPEEILSLTMFKNYAAGNLASLLYIKNLAKDVTAEDFYFIFGSLFGNIDAAKSGLSIKLMQNYAAGNPASVLYIKNLAKDVTAKDFYFIFGSLFGSIDAAKSGLSIKLMQEGRMRGQAFVTFPSAEVAHRALECILQNAI